MRKPTTPQEILIYDFLVPHLADELGYDLDLFNEFINGQKQLDCDLAEKLAKRLGTTVQFWLNAQKAVEKYENSSDSRLS